jgi:hypothetical protein
VTQSLFWRFLRENFISSGGDDWRIFVTSDVEVVELEAIEEFGSDRVIRIPGISSHVDREANLGNDCTRVAKPILDFHFLQMCNKAAISRSGFGRLGTWNRREPLKDVFVFNGQTFETAYDELGEKQPLREQKQQLQHHQQKQLLENVIKKSSNEVRIKFSVFMSGSNLAFALMLILVSIQVVKLVKRKRFFKIMTLCIFILLLLAFLMTLIF